jgi:hypothetical protein
VRNGTTKKKSKPLKSLQSRLHILNFSNPLKMLSGFNCEVKMNNNKNKARQQGIPEKS